MVRGCAIVLSPCFCAGCRLDLSFASDTHHLPACQTRCSARPSAVRCSVQQRYKRSAILPIGIACALGAANAPASIAVAVSFLPRIVFSVVFARSVIRRDCANGCGWLGRYTVVTRWHFGRTAFAAGASSVALANGCWYVAEAGIKPAATCSNSYYTSDVNLHFECCLSMRCSVFFAQLMMH